MSRSSAGRSSRWNSFRRSFPSCRPQKLGRFFLALVGTLASRKFLRSVKSQLHTNDTVRFSGEIWKVVTTINGSKADLQRLNGSNPRIITVAVLHVEVVQRFGSPNGSF